MWPAVVLLMRRSPMAWRSCCASRVAAIFWLALAGALYVALRAVTRRGPGDIGFAVDDADRRDLAARRDAR